MRNPARQTFKDAVKAAARLWAVLAALMVLGSIPGWAGPTGGVIPAGGGSGTIQQNGAVTTIQQMSGRMIVNWKSFSIDAGELVKFIQPSQLAAVLNRVTGLDPSVILGSLQANGRVFLVNPNGIFFGKSARVDVGSMMASTLNIRDEDFLKGIYKFATDPTKPAAFVINQGQIHAGQGGFVVLAAPLVSNEGVIVANLGHVTLSGTEDAAISLDSQGLVNYVLPAGTGPAGDVVIPPEILTQVVKSAVENGAVVQGGVAVKDGSNIRLVGAQGLAINNGSIRADGGGGVTVNGARETLLNGCSVISAQGASGGSGGTITLAGQDVMLTCNALVDASGPAGGGTVRIGGDYQGKGCVPLAVGSYVGPNATVHADATDNGNGGRVYVWGTCASITDGAVTARGGPSGGNGGLVETSAHSGLQVNRVPDVTAVRGVGGTWLLDPFSINISTACCNSFWDPVHGCGAPLDGRQAHAATLSNTLVDAALNCGINVTITTTPHNGATCNPCTPGDIGVLAGVNKSNGASATLKLCADRNITVGGCISSSSNHLNVVLNARRGCITVNSTVKTNGGCFTATSAGAYSQGGTVNTNGGKFCNKGTSYTLTGNTNTGGGTFESRGCAFTQKGNVASCGGSILIGTSACPRKGAVTIGGNLSSGAGSIEISTKAGATTQCAGTTITANGLRMLNVCGGDFTLTNPQDNIATLAGCTHSNVTYRNVGATSVGTVTTADGTSTGLTTNNHNFSLRACGTITVSQPINAGTGTDTLRAAVGGNIVSCGAGSVNGATVNLRADSGTIGTGTSNRLATAAGTLNSTDGAGGAGANCIFINQTGTVTLCAVRAVNKLDILSSNTITVASGACRQVKAPCVALRATNGNIGGTGTITACTLTVTACTGSVGACGAPLLTAIKTLKSGSANHCGQGVFLSDSQGLCVDSATATGTGGTVQLTTTSGGLNLQNGAVVTACASGTVKLTSATGITDGTLTSVTGNALTATATTLGVGTGANPLRTQLNHLTSVTANTANQGVFITNDRGLSVCSVSAAGTAGTINLTTTAGGLTLANGSVMTPAACGTVKLCAADFIHDGNAVSITANNLCSKAGTHTIGTLACPLLTHVNQASAAANGACAGVFLSNNQALCVKSATATGTNGTVHLTTSCGVLTLQNGAVVANATSGTVQLCGATSIANGCATSVTGHALTATSHAGYIGTAIQPLHTKVDTVASAAAVGNCHGVFISNGQSLAVTSATAAGTRGTVQLTATAGSLTLANGAVVTPCACGSVKLTAATSLSDCAAVSVTGNTLTASAGTGSIGTCPNPLNTQINTLTSAAANTACQGVFLTNDRALCVRSATATGANGKVHLTTTAGGLTLQNGAIVTPGCTGSVQLVAKTSITDGTATSVTGNSLIAAATCGTMGTCGQALNTAVHQVSGGAHGLVNLNNSGALTVNRLVSVTSTLNLTNDNSIEVKAPCTAGSGATVAGTSVTLTENGVATGGITVDGPSGTASDPTVHGSICVAIDNASTGAGSGICIQGLGAGVTSPATVTGPTVTVSTTGATGTPHDVTLGGSAIGAVNCAIVSARGSITNTITNGKPASVTAPNGSFTAIGGNVGQDACHPLKTALCTLTLGKANSACQGVFLTNDKALAVTSATATGTNGKVNLTTTAGGLTLANNAIVTPCASGAVTLCAATGIGDGNATSITGNTLSATANTGSVGLSCNPLNTQVNTLTLGKANTACQGVFLTNDQALSVTSATATGTNGKVSLTTTAGGLTLANGAVVTPCATGTVTLCAKAGITDSTGTAVTANALTAKACTASIGSLATPLHTQIHTLTSAAANAASQGVFLSNDQALCVQKATATGACGTVQLTTTVGGLTLATNAVVTPCATGTVKLTAATGISDGNAVSVTGNALTATATTRSIGGCGSPLCTQINVLTSATANSANQGVFLTNDRALCVQRASAIGTCGKVKLTTTAGGLTLANGAITAPKTTLCAASSITDGTAASITGCSLTETAGTGTIGALCNPLNTAIHTLSGSAHGLINQSNTGTLTVNKLTSTTDTVTLANLDDGTTVTAPTTAGAGATISGTVVCLTQNGTGSIVVNGPSGTACAPTIQGTTSVSITDAGTGAGNGVCILGAGGTAPATVCAPTVTVKTTGATGTPHNITLGGKAIKATDATLTANGTIQDGGTTSVAAANGTFKAVGGNVGQNACNPLHTSLGTLVCGTANCANQGVFLSNNKGLIVLSANATGSCGAVQVTTTCGGITLVNGAVNTASGSGSVKLTAATGIADGTGTAVTGNTLTASAGSGSIGSAGTSLHTHINTLASATANSACQGVFLSNDQALNVTSATATGTCGSVQLATTAGDLTLANNAVVTPAASGKVKLCAAGSIKDGANTSVTGNVLTATAAAGSIGSAATPLHTHINTLTSATANSANQGVFVSNNQALAVTSASATGMNGIVNLTTTAGGITLANNAVVTSGTTGSVKLQAATGISDSTLTSITGNSLCATAGTGSVGSAANPLNTHINVLTGATADGGGQGVFLSNDRALCVTSANATGANGSVQLTTTCGNVTLANNAIVTPTANGSVQIQAAGSILDGTATSITGNTLTATANTGSIGACGNPLGTKISNLSATAHGLINVSNCGPLTIQKMASATCAVSLAGTDGITIAGPTTAGATPTLSGTTVSLTETGSAAAGITIDGPSGTACAPTIQGTNGVTITNASTNAASGIATQSVGGTAPATVCAPSVTVQTTGAGTTHNVCLGTGAIKAANSATVAANGSIRGGTGVSVTSADGTLTASGGSVGQNAANPLNTSLGTLVSASANSANQGVFLSNHQNLVVTSATATGTNGAVNIATPGASLTLLNGAIVTPSGTGTVSLAAGTSLTDGTATSVTGNALTASAGTGSIGSAANPLNTQVNTLTSAAADTACQGVFLSNDQSLGVTSATATGSNGKVQIATTAGNLTLANGAVVTPGGSGAVSLTAGAGITDGSATSVTANTLTASAGTGSIGSAANPLNTLINTLTSATANSACQGVFVTNPQSLAVTSATATGTNGTVQIGTTVGGLTLANNAIQANTVNLTGATSISDGAAVSITGNTLTASAGTGSLGSAGNPLNTQINTLTSGTANTACQGVFLTNDQSLGVTSATATGTNGTVQIATTGGSLTLANGAVVTPGDTGTVQLTAVNSITDGNATSVTAGDLTAVAGAGSIGTTGAALNTRVHDLTARADSNNQGVNVSNSGALTLDDVEATGDGGTVTVANDSAMNAALVTAGDAANPGTATLTSSTGDLTLRSVTAANGTANLTASQGNVLGGAGVAVTAGTGNLFALSNVGSTGSPLQTNVGTINATAQNGSVNVTQGSSLTVGNVQAGTDVNLTDTCGSVSVNDITAGNTVNLSAPGGAILNLGHTVVANTANLNAGWSIGVCGNPLRTRVGTLNATANSGIFICQEAGFTLGTLANNGAGTIQVANQSGDMNLGTVTNLGGGVFLLSNGNITDNLENGTVDVTANGRSALIAGGQIGTRQEPIDVNITGGTLATQSGNGSVFVIGNFVPASVVAISTTPGLVIENGRPVGGQESVDYFSSLSDLNPYIPVETLRVIDARAFWQHTYPVFDRELLTDPIYPSMLKAKSRKSLIEVEGGTWMRPLGSLAAAGSRRFVTEATRALVAAGWSAQRARAAARRILAATPGDTTPVREARAEQVRALLAGS